MTATTMISARIPTELSERLTAFAEKSTKSAVIADAIRLHIDPHSGGRILNMESARQRDELIDRLGLIASTLRQIGGLMALAVKRKEGVDCDPLEQTRQKVLEIAEAIASAIEQFLERAG